MVAELAAICREVEHSPPRASRLLTGAGEKSFCAGGDISAWSSETPEDFGRFWVRDGHAHSMRWPDCASRSIAVLNGDALAADWSLRPVPTFASPSAHARIGMPETGLGMIPGWSGTQRAVRRFGQQVVRRMALFGEVFSAEDALQLGLVDQLCDKGEGMAAASALAAKLLARSPQATATTKMLINAAEGEERERVLDAIAGELAAGSRDLAEGLDAFREQAQAGLLEGRLVLVRSSQDHQRVRARLHDPGILIEHAEIDRENAAVRPLRLALARNRQDCSDRVTGKYRPGKFPIPAKRRDGCELRRGLVLQTVDQRQDEQAVRDPVRETVPCRAFLAHMDFEPVPGQFREPVDMGGRRS